MVSALLPKPMIITPHAGYVWQHSVTMLYEVTAAMLAEFGLTSGRGTVIRCDDPAASLVPLIELRAPVLTPVGAACNPIVCAHSSMASHSVSSCRRRRSSASQEPHRPCFSTGPTGTPSRTSSAAGRSRAGS